MSEWQPIETAPKDGTLILLWRVDQVEIAKWMDGPCNEWWHTQRGEPLSSFHKYDAAEPVPDDWELPTHWMPLPPEPKS